MRINEKWFERINLGVFVTALGAAIVPLSVILWRGYRPVAITENYFYRPGAGWGSSIFYWFSGPGIGGAIECMDAPCGPTAFEAALNDPLIYLVALVALLIKERVIFGRKRLAFNFVMLIMIGWLDLISLVKWAVR